MGEGRKKKLSSIPSTEPSSKQGEIVNKLTADLENIVIESQFLLKHSLRDLYLCTYALRNKSLSRAADFNSEHLYSSGGRQQIERMNDTFKTIFGNEELYVRTKKGEIEPTEIGKIFMEEIENLILEAGNTFHRIRVNQGREIKIAATQFMMDLVCKIYPQWQKILRNSSIDLKLIRTAELEQVLVDRKADLAFGATILNENGNFKVSDELEFTPIMKESIGILTNIETESIETEKKFREFTEGVSLIIPKSGLMRHFTNSMLKKYDGLQDGIVDWCHDIFFGISLMQNNIIKNSMMFVLRGAAEWTKSIWEREDGLVRLRYIELDDKLLTTFLYVGLFRRKIDGDLDESHPLNRCWKTFYDKFALK